MLVNTMYIYHKFLTTKREVGLRELVDGEQLYQLGFKMGSKYELATNSTQMLRECFGLDFLL